MPAPGWVGRMVFRPLAALYFRKDTGPDRGSAQANMIGRFFSGVRFARGKGHVPRTHAAIPEATFADADWDLEKAADAMARGGFRHLVVVEEGEVHGIISMRDIMAVWRPSARDVSAPS